MYIYWNTNIVHIKLCYFLQTYKDNNEISLRKALCINSKVYTFFFNKIYLFNVNKVGHKIHLKNIFGCCIHQNEFSCWIGNSHSKIQFHFKKYQEKWNQVLNFEFPLSYRFRKWNYLFFICILFFKSFFFLNFFNVLMELHSIKQLRR